GLKMQAQSASSKPDRPQSALAVENPYCVTMARGTTFEVVALGRFPMGWWRPDGTPLDVPLADSSRDAYSVDAGQVLLTVLVRVQNLPKEATLKWVPTYDQGCYRYLGGDDSGVGVTKGGRRVPDLQAYVVALSSARRIGSIQIQFAAGP